MIQLQPTSLPVRFYLAFRNPLLVFLVVLIVGSTGFWIVSEYKATPLDCIYMTFITVATIGFGETIDLSHSPGGRMFLMAIATVGIANVTYATSKLTAFILEGDLNESLRRRRMQDRIDKLKNHYIICGVGRVGTNVAHELHVTDRPFVAVEDAQAAIEAFHDKYPKTLVLHGDSSDDDVLRRANNTPFGLGSGVWTRDVSKAHQVAGALKAGTVWVNCYLQLDPAIPFGGYKMSGYGRESGTEHMDHYLNTKSVVVRLS